MRRRRATVPVDLYRDEAIDIDRGETGVWMLMTMEMTEALARGEAHPSLVERAADLLKPWPCDRQEQVKTDDMTKAMPKQKPGRSQQDVRTPGVFLAAVRARLHIDAFTIDLAASRENTVAKKFYSERTNSLIQDWNRGGFNWCNPPFGDIGPWVKKAVDETTRGASTAMLVPASVGSNWWRDFVHEKCRVLLLNGRLTFVGHTQPYPKDCALLLYAPDQIIGYEVWTWEASARKVAA